MFEDIPILPPRVAGRWHCAKCGEPGAKPEEGHISVDPRYAIGYCDCTTGRRNRVSGYQRERVSLIADFAFDRGKWLDQQAMVAERKAFEKVQAGMPYTPEEMVLSMRWRKRSGLPDA